MNLYRYYDHWIGDNSVTVGLESFYVYKETAQGYWISDFSKKRWVSKTSKKKFAYPTIEQAQESFRRRKVRQIKILKSQLTRAELALATPLNDNTEITRVWNIREEEEL